MLCLRGFARLAHGISRRAALGPVRGGGTLITLRVTYVEFSALRVDPQPPVFDDVLRGIMRTHFASILSVVMSAGLLACGAVDDGLCPGEQSDNVACTVDI